MKRFWLSWYDTRHGKWELHSPWWVSGERGDAALTICAAVRAPDEESAKRLIIMAHDEPRPRELEWRFVEERPADWSPFCDRFPRAAWNRWPDKPETSASQ